MHSKSNLIAGFVVATGFACAAGCATVAPPSSSLSENRTSDNPTPANVSTSPCTAAEGARPFTASIEEIAATLRGGDFKKREFEKSAEFKKRLAERVAAAQRKANPNSDGEFFVSIPIPPSQLKYDPDGETMTIGSEYSGLLEKPMLGDRGDVLIKKTQHPTGSYIGSNSFGVKKEIIKMRADQLVAAIPGGDYVGWPAKFKPLTIRMAPDEARKARDNFVVLLSARLVSPYLSASTSHFSPTISAPFDIDTHSEKIHFEASCAIVYNRASARKYADLSLVGD